ncbi:hypothetical protein [Flavobacterium gilvum]|uniref:Uncharacterized protein n=1 Tax=Flavobacterium gilvum TaxID=1492737 RepID=A0AAC9N6L0_9FLAO|nr:hypothetical protein [Flavobacterium gilvum]AOW10482.1 hypothetical protein EM308_13770 [Flavobacterium gilvum]KFC61138.1 hypothetical protein FEM08_00740 [Flavobacterium gilvum]
MKKETLILEPSTNTHVLEAEKIEMKKLNNGIIQLKITGNGIVTHGEHGTIKTEAEYIIKYIQQEINPISRVIQNVFD